MTETPTGRQQDSVAQFCRDFAAVLDERGISVREAAERSQWSKSAVGNARTGPRLPRVELVSGVLEAVGVEPAVIQDWTLRHAALALTQAQEPSLPEPPAPAEPPGERRGPRFLVPAVALVLGLVAGGVAGHLLTAGSAPPVTTAVVTVQNKVALGAQDLVEDTGPAYLSGRPIAFCGARDCKLPGTEVGTGALLPATCVAAGEKMWNYNLDSPAVRNPHRAESDLWYRVSWPDGRSGYLSEVYLAPPSRGGAGLPSC